MIFIATIYNEFGSTLISGTSKADTIENSGGNVTVNAGEGNDSVTNYFGAENVSSTSGSDFIGNGSDKISINAGNGNDKITSKWFKSDDKRR